MADIVISGNTSGSVTLRAPDTSGSTVLTLPTSSGTLVVTGGAQTVQFAAGSAASPSITFTGDTNTGIFSPAADTIAFTEGGVESMRIDSAGNVGIGVTPSPWSNFKALQISSIGALAAHDFGSGNTQVRLISNAYWDGANFRYITSNTAAMYSINGREHIWSSVASGTAGNSISFTESMRIDSNGNLLVGTTTASAKLTVNGSVYAQNFGNGGTAFQLNDNTGTAVNQFIDVSLAKAGGAYNYMKFAFNNIDIISWGGPLSSYSDILTLNSPQSSIVFRSANTERMRILGGGDLGYLCTGLDGDRPNAVGTYKQTNGNTKVRVVSDGTAAFQFYSPTGGATLVGNIAVNASSVSYNTTSDYRLKENITPMVSALSKVALLKPCTYTWKAEGSAGQGFIAHELQEVIPEAVTGEKDAVNEDGSIKPQGIDTSFLVATLTAAIQELNAKVEAQAAEIAALKGVN